MKTRIVKGGKDRICIYCNKDVTAVDYEYYLVRKATKPKGSPYRWKIIGFCCDNCYNKGHRVEINEQ